MCSGPEDFCVSPTPLLGFLGFGDLRARGLGLDSNILLGSDSCGLRAELFFGL